MDSSSSFNTSNERLEQIVAYLDGELSSEESSQVEQKLARDEKFRQELQSLELAWAELDKLPAATVDDKFSQTTMELVVQDARREVQQRTIALPMQQKKRRLSSALILGTCILLGLIFSRIILDGPNRKLITNLSVIEYIDLYSQFEKVEFASELQKRLKKIPNVLDFEEEKISNYISEYQQVNHAEDAEHWLANLGPEQKASLRVKFNRFHTLSEDRQQELSELQKKVVKLDQDQLGTLLFFNQWLKTISSVEQYEIRLQENPRERAQLVANMVANQKREKALQLSDNELKDLLRIAMRHVVVALSKSDTKTKRDFHKSDMEYKLKMFQENMPAPERIKVYMEMIQNLPEDTRQYLQAMPMRKQSRQLRVWLQQARMLEMPKGERSLISEEELEDFFATELNIAEQEMLLALPRDQMMKRLERIYRGDDQQNQLIDRRSGGPPPGMKEGFGPPIGNERRRPDGFGPPGPPRRGEFRGPPTHDRFPPDRDIRPPRGLRPFNGDYAPLPKNS